MGKTFHCSQIIPVSGRILLFFLDLIDAKIQYLEEKTGLSPPPIPVDSLNAQSSEEEVDEILDDDDFEHQARLEGISPATGSRFAPPMSVSPAQGVSFPAPGVPSEGLKTDICSACGKDLTQDSKFCRHCGAPVTEKKRLASSPSGGNSKLYIRIAVLVGYIFTKSEQFFHGITSP